MINSRLEIAHKAADFIAQYKTTGELPDKRLLFIW